jgi:hypothetical protein
MAMIIDGTNGLTFNNATTQASAGSVLQVVNATYGTQVTTATSTFIDTGLTATITPKFATSKILVTVFQNGCAKSTSDTTLQIKIQRNSSDILVLSGAGAYTQNGDYNNIGTIGGEYLDSPATTSAVTYKTVFCAFSAAPTVIVQSNQALQSVSTITLMEIAA